MEVTFTNMEFDLAAASGCSRVSSSGPVSEPVAKLIQILHRALLAAPEHMRCQLDAGRPQPLQLMWFASGLTAGVAYWMHGNRVDGISLLVSGLDLVEDLAALQLAISSLPGVVPERAVDAILQAPRP